MKNVLVIVSVIFLYTSCVLAQQDAKELIKAKAEALGKATIAGEYDKVVDATYPKVVEMGGGREKVIEQAHAAMNLVKAQGFSITAFVVGTPGSFVDGGGKTYCILPTTATLDAPTAKITAQSYLLGISSDKGKTWTFIDGSGLKNPGEVKKILPDLPKAVLLPKEVKPTVERK